MVKSFSLDFLKDTKIFFSALLPKKVFSVHIALLFAITLAATIYRFAEIGNAISYDEAYNYLAFIRGTLFQTATDYHLPNNHIFLSLILNLVFHTFGGELWVLRMPTLLVGVMMIPATYILGKKLYSPATGILAAIGVAAFPELIHFSVIFRGYILIAFFTLLALSLGNDLRLEKNRFGWAALIVIFALGLYTIPIMLFPFATLYYWLLFAFLVNDIGESYTSKFEFLRYWFISGILTALATIALYSPILLFSPDDLFHHNWLIPVPWEILSNRMWGKFLNTWAIWFAPIPTWLVMLGVFGAVFSLVFHKKFTTHKIPLLFAFVVGIMTVILIQRPNAWARVWSFFIAPMLIWATAGVVEPLRKFKVRVPLDKVMISIAFIALLWGGARRIPDLSIYPSKTTNVEAAADYLIGELRQGDMILMDGTYNSLMWYHLISKGEPEIFFQRRDKFERVFLIVVTKDGGSLAVLKKKFEQRYKLNFSTLQHLRNYGNFEIYEVFPLP